MNIDQLWKSLTHKFWLPSGMDCVAAAQVLHNQEIVSWFRLQQKNTSAALGSEHFSFTWSVEQDKLMGLMFLQRDFTIPEVNIDAARAESLAMKFLKQVAPDLLQRVEVRWVKPQRQCPQDPPHDSGFPLSGCPDVIGMRVKLWDTKNKNYAWVIIANDERIISFERDITWDSARHCRGTSLWLHDDWLAKNDVHLTPLTQRKEPA